MVRLTKRHAGIGRWGMIPPGTPAHRIEKAEKVPTYNAKSETADKLWTFRGAWQRGQHCIIPAEAIYEPDWRSGKAVATRCTRADGAPLGIAGLWDRHKDAAGNWQLSYTMLTINADAHPLFKEYHQPGKEKRMVVILSDESYKDWLAAGPADTRDFLQPYPADALVAMPEPK